MKFYLALDIATLNLIRPVVVIHGTAITLHSDAVSPLGLPGFNIPENVWDGQSIDVGLTDLGLSELACCCALLGDSESHIGFWSLAQSTQSPDFNATFLSTEDKSHFHRLLVLMSWLRRNPCPVPMPGEIYDITNNVIAAVGAVHTILLEEFPPF